MNELLRRMLNLPPQASSVARAVDHLHFTVILITMAGAAAVGLIGTYFLVRYRQRGDDIPLTPRVVAPHWLEGGVAVGLLALFCAFWVVGFRQYRTIESPPADAMPIYVTAKQWMWQFAYPDGPSQMETLTVPVGQPVKLIMSSRDVIHSFSVPAFRIKQDVVPGHATVAWFTAVEPGTYDVLCTQYCGLRHSLMRAQIVALPAADYARWLDASRDPLALPGAKGEGQGLAARGHAVAAERGCLRCHSTDGTPYIGPTWAGAFGAERALADGSHVRIDEAYLTESMMDPAAKVAAGYAAVMPSYQGVLTPEQTSAIIEYIRSLRAVVPTATVPAPAAPISYPIDSARSAP